LRWARAGAGNRVAHQGPAGYYTFPTGEARWASDLTWWAAVGRSTAGSYGHAVFHIQEMNGIRQTARLEPIRLGASFAIGALTVTSRLALGLVLTKGLPFLH